MPIGISAYSILCKKDLRHQQLRSEIICLHLFGLLTQAEILSLADAYVFHLPNSWVQENMAEFVCNNKASLSKASDRRIHSNDRAVVRPDHAPIATRQFRIANRCTFKRRDFSDQNLFWAFNAKIRYDVAGATNGCRINGLRGHFGGSLFDERSIAMSASTSSRNAALLLGDTHTDIVASRAARVKSVAATWGAQDLHSLVASGPDLLVASPAELRDVLQNLGFCGVLTSN